MNSNLKRQIVHSLLLAVGLVIRQITPGFLGGIKPDFMLAILFVIIIFNNDYQTTLITGIVAGILAAMTTTFPAGQIPNIIDKIITTHVIYLTLLPFRKFRGSKVKSIIIGFLGTAFSGSVFLYTALLITGLPAPFEVLFISVVIPTAAINAAVTPALLVLLKRALKATNLQMYSTVNN
ncbi:tryptophan transporter [Clostridium sediminicola]|uniref:tryptophan transporter n=1 Tax=Clostridium sediminicola TaxID=3114879 RepID=UPI0031F1CE19